MRLINIYTMKMAEFLFEEAPDYVILSHRWSDDELTYEEFVGKPNKSSIGYKKIQALCEFVKTMGTTLSLNFNMWAAQTAWVWIDTCCIDKRSSAELSEAINSMWNYYSRCTYCVAYLIDVEYVWDLQRFRESEWFTRGWTLQELLAPRQMVFCTQHWKPIGTKLEPKDLSAEVATATGVERRYLNGQLDISRACAAEKLRWASKRITTRGEDQAYCLLGLLQVNMPLLYGEGRSRAFLRLQEEFIGRSDDESIFAWAQSMAYGFDVEQKGGMLAEEPSWFTSVGLIERMPDEHVKYTPRPPYAVTNKGLQFVASGVLLKSSPANREEVLLFGNPKLEEEDSCPVEAPSQSQLHIPYVDQFVFALNCLDRSKRGRHVTSPVDEDADIVLIVLERRSKDKWRRLLPPDQDQNRYAMLWTQGRKIEQPLLVQLQGILTFKPESYWDGTRFVSLLGMPI